MSELYKCQNCDFVGSEDDCVEAKDVMQRHAPGDAFSDLECTVCGALCMPLSAGIEVDLDELCYVLWESGYLEEFPDRDDAGHEIMACESRGMKGAVIHDDLNEAVLAMGNRLKVHMTAEDHERYQGHHAKQVRDLAALWPMAWSCSAPRGRTALLLGRRKASEEDEGSELEFALLITTDNRVEVKGVSLQGLPDVLTTMLTPDGLRRQVLEKVWDLIDTTYPKGPDGKRDYSGDNSRSACDIVADLCALEAEVSFALGKTLQSSD